MRHVRHLRLLLQPRLREQRRRRRRGPRQGLEPEGLHDLALKAEGALGTDKFHVFGVAGERSVRIAGREPRDWLKSQYRHQKEASHDVA